MSERNTSERAAAQGSEQAALQLASEIMERYELADLAPLVRAIRAQDQKRELNLAVFGRFNTGKSSVLNQLIGQPLLPVGVVPVTSVVTEICYGSEERAEAVLLDGKTLAIPLGGIGSYISEAENPRNGKGIDTVRVFLPSLARFRGVKFVDTPGLESLFRHNTDASLSWSPNVDLAVVAVGADAPLTQQDRELIGRLARFTPNLCVLLTKVDTLDADGQREVLEYVEGRLRAEFAEAVPVLAYSIRPGYEALRERFEREQVKGAQEAIQARRWAARERKLETLLSECGDYLRLALKSAETLDAEREELRERVLGSAQALGDRKLQLQLLARHAAGKTRSLVEEHLERTVRRPLEKKLEQSLGEKRGGWRGSLAKELAGFEGWLRGALREELAAVSGAEQGAFLAPLRELERQCRANLQSFRDELSEKVQRVFGVPLRTTESELEVEVPRSPDVSVGKIFDHNWELISWVIPMTIFRGAVEAHFREKIASEVYKNLSRLNRQWEELVNAGIAATGVEAQQRFDQLTVTVQRLLSSGDRERAGAIRPLLEQISAALAARRNDHAS